MTGRHRGRPRDRETGEAAEERAPRLSRRRGAVIAGAFLLPVVLATVVAFALREEPVDGPDGAATPTPKAARVSPSAEPTFGQYVPPASRPQAETKAPARAARPSAEPSRRPSPAPTRPPESRPPCPWSDVPFFDRWCHRHRHMGR
ncbi:hypothetical protein [Actinomadura opuntiae]|uniref:hypothetical protein n=1 Tax=Actinomadura sp. OS1-43 TaxID=604315 RepID=UPI00255A901B|nr:hypothetical protein [Actinomadura sp. OS1-43]MDL4815493.1 hypothetical protein [Actinomadura sp. OS1-43]